MLGYTVKNNAQRENAYQKLKALLDENEIDHIFVKGIIIKDYYPVPELRTSGDIDVIVRKDLSEIKDIAEQKGVKIDAFVSNALTLTIDEISIEIHNQADVLTDYFSDIFALCEKDGFEYSLNEYDHLFYVLCHLAKHLTYRGAGVRMLLDVDLMVRHIDSFDYEKLIDLSDKYGIKRTVETILSFCNYWFATPVTAAVDFKSEPEFLNNLESVFIDGGSFGHTVNTIPLKYLVNNGSKFKIIMSMAFPSRDYLKVCYPYYKNNKWLYPIARINRLTDGVFKRGKNTKKALNQISKGDNAKIYIDLINELGLEPKERI